MAESDQRYILALAERRRNFPGVVYGKANKEYTLTISDKLPMQVAKINIYIAAVIAHGLVRKNCDDDHICIVPGVDGITPRRSNSVSGETKMFRESQRIDQPCFEPFRSFHPR
jgi:hypothetical protein